MNAGTIEPMVACPHAVDNVKPLSEVAGIKVDQAFLGTCTNGRLEDIAAAAEIVKGKRISPNTRLIVIPASSQIYLEAMQSGLSRDLCSNQERLSKAPAAVLAWATIWGYQPRARSR